MLKWDEQYVVSLIFSVRVIKQSIVGRHLFPYAQTEFEIIYTWVYAIISILFVSHLHIPRLNNQFWCGPSKFMRAVTGNN